MDITIDTDLMVAVRDGTGLATNVYRPAGEESLPASAVCTCAGGHFPSPTSVSVPVMLRTIWCRKERASTCRRTWSPSRTMSSLSSVRNGLFAWQSESRN